MHRLKFLTCAGSLAVLCAVGVPGARGAASAKPDHPTYRLTHVFHVGGRGRWDYMKLGPGGAPLFITRQYYTLALNPTSMKVIATIGGNHGSHGVALDPALHRGFISNGVSGTITVFSLKNYRTLGTVKAAHDADCIIFDPASKNVMAFCGHSRVMVAIPADVRLGPGLAKGGRVVPLGGIPEFAVSDGRGHVYDNIVSKCQVVVIDTKTMRIVHRYSTLPGRHPSGLSIDPRGHYLFIGCRNKKMIVMNAHTGRVLASLPIGAGVDATAFDGRCALASCGDGTLTAVRKNRAGHFVVDQVIKTQHGARTMAVDGRRGIIYLATSNLTPNPHGWPKPVPGTFRVLVVRRK